jgi:hypothetical protein
VEDSNAIPKENLVARRLKRGDRYSDGRKVPPWKTYSPPPVYAREPQVVHIKSRAKDQVDDTTGPEGPEADSMGTKSQDKN